MEPAAVHQPGDDLADVVLGVDVRGDGAVELVRVRQRRSTAASTSQAGRGRLRQGGDDVPDDLQGMLIVLGQVVRDAGDPGVHVAAAELLGGDDLADRGLHQRRAAQEDGALVADDHGLVAHRRNVGAAGGAGAHHGGDLRDLRRGHPRLVVEDPAEVLLVREDLVLLGQERAARVHEVDAGQPVLQRDFLRPQVLLDRHRIVGAALDGGVVGDHQHLAAVHQADAGDHPGARANRRCTCRWPPAGRSPGTGCRHPAAGRSAPAAAACRGPRGARGTSPARPAPPRRAVPAAPRRAPAAPRGSPRRRLAGGVQPAGECLH